MNSSIESLSLSSRTLSVTSHARLHCGFMSLNSHDGRHFGSIGLAIDAFQASLTAYPREGGLIVEGLDDGAALHNVLRDFMRAQGLRHGALLRYRRTIPRHQGLGSGTQHGLLAAAALTRINGRTFDASVAAPALQRARRSGIGTYTFMHGGFIIDRGKRVGHESVPSLFARVAFPAAWRVLLLVDSDTQGCHGNEERRAFDDMNEGKPSFDANELACRLRDAVRDERFDVFAQGIGMLQDFMGATFAQAQGGNAYVSARVANALQRLKAAGVRGCGQSSWGPTGFAFFKTEQEARDAQDMLDRTSTRDNALDTCVSKACQHGAVYT